TVLGLDVHVPTPGEYVADGAARQAAWVLSGSSDAPAWNAASAADVYSAPGAPHVRAQYAAVRELTGVRPA
ncbi:MAG TPA: xylulose kinase, partial [Cellulomonas sp.]|nr:xylulose kinase [Cellulomonas sp.]